MSAKKIADISIRGNRIVVKDTMMMLDAEAPEPEWPGIACEPGEYSVSVLTRDGETVGARILRAGAAEPKPGREIGPVAVDSGSIAFCDYDPLLAAVRADPDAYADWTDDECESAVFGECQGVLEFGGAALAYLDNGVGDGSFMVTELLDGARVVGAECRFEPLGD